MHFNERYLKVHMYTYFEKHYHIYTKNKYSMVYNDLFSYLLKKKIIFKSILNIILASNVKNSKEKSNNDALMFISTQFNMNIKSKIYLNEQIKNIDISKYDCIMYLVWSRANEYLYKSMNEYYIYILNQIIENKNNTSYIIKIEYGILLTKFIVDYIHILNALFKQVIIFKSKTSLYSIYIICHKKNNTISLPKIIIQTKDNYYISRLFDNKYNYDNSIITSFMSTLLEEMISQKNLYISLFNLQHKDKDYYNLIMDKILIYKNINSLEVNLS